MRKTPLTLDQHKALGSELKAMRDRLLEISLQFDGARSGATPARHARLAMADVDRLRSALDNILLRDGGPDFNELINVYYPVVSDNTDYGIQRDNKNA